MGGVLEGKLYRVLDVDPSGRVHGKCQNGKSFQFWVNEGPSPNVGDVIILGENRWELAPDTAWITENQFGVVRQLLEPNCWLVSDGISLKRVRNLLNIEVDAGNTVEFNDIDGIVAVTAKEPITRFDDRHVEHPSVSEFLIGKKGEGPFFEDFGGYPEVVRRVRELIETQLNNSDCLNEIKARPVKGVLFTGPPGTGKTHLARVIANEVDADFYLVSGPEIISKWVGDSELLLRAIFAAACANEDSKAIIFFDEIDSIAERRTGETHEASKRLVAQLLTLMDGFDTKTKNVVVVAATNRVEDLDPAVTRPGRFDWQIEFAEPGLEDRFEILRVGSKSLRTAADLPFLQIATRTEGWSAADLASIWTEAALLAAGDRRNSIQTEDFVIAWERVSEKLASIAQRKRSAKSA